MTYVHVNHDCALCKVGFTPVDIEETMGQRISRLMEAKRIKQSELARRLKVSRMTVSQWVSDTSEPRPANLLALADTLGTDAHYLVFGASRVPGGDGTPSEGGAVRRRRAI